jgi:plastocyanin
MKRIHAALFAATLVVAASCGGGSDSPTGTTNNGGVTVNASNSLVFAPNSVSIATGQTVTWVFGSIDHNVIFGATAGAPAAIGTSHSTSVTRTFNTAGTFAYVCTFHNGMTGVVVVGAGGDNSYSGY